MAKRGQFYILAAVILCIVIFGITVTVNKIDQEVEATDFIGLAQNYVLETPELINYAIYEEEDPSELLIDFTDDFVNYARKRNPNLGLLYVYKDEEGEVKIVNYLQEGTTIRYETIDENGEEGEDELFEFGDITLNEIALEVGGEEFTYAIPTKLEHFGSSHDASLGEATKWVKFDIGGVPYVFNIKDGVNFEVIIKGKSESKETEVVCSTLDGTQERLSCI